MWIWSLTRRESVDMSVNWLKFKMIAQMRATLFRHLLSTWVITVLILANGQCSLCGPSIDRSLDSHALQRMGRAATQGFNLVATGASSTTHAKGRRRHTIEQTVRINPIKSIMEVDILMAFKSGITSDPLGVLNRWRANDSDPCRWPGVGCSENSKHVTTLKLKGLQLVGTVSSLLGQLPFLQQLDLSENFLHSSVPASLSNCSNLLYLNISFNEMNGDIPALVGKLENLQALDLSNNNLSGGIPETLGNCSALRHLDLGTNSFEGVVPSQFGNLSNLQFLSLENSSISGSVPSTMGNCSSLTQLWLSYNLRLGGELPFQLGDLIHLRDFRVLRCSFQGGFPMWTLNLTSLQELNLGENQFSGQLPQAWGQLANLTFLGLESNVWDGSEIPHDLGSLRNLVTLNIENGGLVGEIPRSSFNITSLRSLLLHENQLTGAIPDDIGLLRNLEWLYLWSNAFSGVLPSSLSNCSLLQFLYVGENPGFNPQRLASWIGSFQNLAGAYLTTMNLQGEIPKEIGQLSQLGEFIVSENNLSGVIPSSMGNCSALYNLVLEQNQLTGEVPPELGQLSQQLNFLQLGENFFSARPFPACIYNLTNLVRLTLENNQFNGKLDGDFGRFQLLEEFLATNNNFQGPIPESLSNCSDVNTLELGGNTFSGEIPLWLANLTKLQFLQLGSNHFHGSIPAELLENFRLMQFLDLSNNNLGGSVPVNIGQLVFLQELNMSANTFAGLIPDSLANCTQLLSVDLSQNRLTSNIPGDAFAMMASLIMLNLSGNLLSGSWPSKFVELKRIVVINVSANNISGAIPMGLGGCLLLESLDLSFNQFSGEIPQDLGLLKHLTTFNASYNNFSGPIPDSGAFKANLTMASFLGNPGLCGGILGPQRQCAVGAASPIGRSHCKGFTCAHVWISVLVSVVGFVILLLGALYICSYCYPKKDDRDLGLVTFTIDPRMRLKKSDILATIDAGEDSVIGKGPQSVVYKAVLSGGEIVAIKVVTLDPRPSTIDRQKNNEKETLSEAHTLAQLRHRNIIKVFGLYSTEDIRAIVLEYMPKGSLYVNLHGSAPCELTWAERFKILVGVTHGMVYLHHEFPDPIIHRDLKSSNILLDADMEPKLCDFGISKFVAYDNGEVTASTMCGTFGYMPPEYGTGMRVSTKGDVYSFGVVLFELLTAKEVTQSHRMNDSGEDEGLVLTVHHSFEESNIAGGTTPFELLDSILQNEGVSDVIVGEKMMSALRLGLFCTRVQPENRPSMNIVLQFLLEIEKIGEETVNERKTLDDLLKENVVPVPDHEILTHSEL